jgi:hypothetical protein
VLDAMLSAAGRNNSVHELLADALFARSYQGRYKNLRLSDERSVIRDDDVRDPLATKLGNKTTTNPPMFTAGPTVAKVEVKGDKVQLTFKHESHKTVDLVGCHEDLDHPTRIDHGNIIYASVGCKEKTVTINDTPEPVLIPKTEATNITAGVTVVASPTVGRGEPGKARDAHVIYVKKGADMVNVLGFHVP